MTNRKLILCDVDGVSCNYAKGFLKVANRLAGTNYTESDVTSWELLDTCPDFRIHEDAIYDIISEPGWARQLEVYEGSKEAVERLRGIGDVYCVTSPLVTSTWCYDRNRWLQEHFGFKSREIIFAKEKSFISGTVLIDDKPENIEGWMKRERREGAVLFKRPWNTSFSGHHPKLLHTNDWNTISDFVESL